MIEIMRLRNMIGVTQVTAQRSLFTSSDAQKITTLLQDKYFFFFFFFFFFKFLEKEAILHFSDCKCSDLLKVKTFGIFTFVIFVKSHKK